MQAAGCLKSTLRRTFVARREMRRRLYYVKGEDPSPSSGLRVHVPTKESFEDRILPLSFGLALAYFSSVVSVVSHDHRRDLIVIISSVREISLYSVYRSSTQYVLSDIRHYYYYCC